MRPICSKVLPRRLEYKPFATRCMAFALLLAPIASPSQEVDIRPLPQAHAHNDYYHSRPLLDALDSGFCSVEADIFLVGEALLVAHSQFEIRKDKTLESLYLDPLKDLVRKRGGKIYPNGPAFTLLIDFKNDGNATYAVLRKKLVAYQDILSRVENGISHPGAVQIVISGNRPVEAISRDAVRYVGIDGRLSDLDSTMAAHLMPMISDRWSSHFRWRGEGEFPEGERKKLL